MIDYGFTSEEIEQLRIKYLIPKGSKEIYQNDLEFVLMVKARLREALSNFWLATVENYDDHYVKGIMSIMGLAKDIEDNMLNCSSPSIMRKLRFVNNLESEIEDVNYEIYEQSNRFTYINARHVQSKTKDVGKFLQYIASDALIRDDRLKMLEEECASVAAERLLIDVKANALTYIDEKHLRDIDLYYLYAHVLKEMRYRERESETYYKENCETCTRDDCRTYYCKNLSDRDRIDGFFVAYRNLSKMLHDKLVNKDIPYWMLDVSDEKRLPEKVIRVTKAFVGKDAWLEGIDHSITQGIIVDYGTEKNVCIDPVKVKISLYKRLSLGKGIDYNDLDDILIYILLTDCDFSQTYGDKEHESFMARYNSLLEQIDANCYLNSGNSSKFNDLLSLYKDYNMSCSKILVGSSEPKGD